MSLVLVIGWTAAAVGAFFAMPQFVRIARSRNSAGLSLRGWQLQSAVSLAWVGHGIMYAMANQIAANAVIGFCSLGILWFVLRDRKLDLWRVAIPVLIAAAVLIAIDLWLGQVAFGLVLIVPIVGSLSAQLRQMIAAPDLSGVSPGYLVLAAVIQVLWLVWSFMVTDWSVTLSSLASFTLLAANLIVWAVRSVRLRAAHADALGVRAPAH